VYADAELAYSYNRMGPMFCIEGSKLFEKVLDYNNHYPGIDKKGSLECTYKLRAIWSYGIILANQRILSPPGFGNIANFKRHANGDPENFFQRSCHLLKTVVYTSKLAYYVAHAWILLQVSFINYKNIYPKRCRNLEIKRLIGYTGEECLENAIKATKSMSKGDSHVLFLIGKAYRKWPLKNLEKSEKCLREALKGLDKHPVIYHQLALLCVDKWLLTYSDRPRRNTPEIKRDPGNPLLREAIGYLEKAVEYNYQISALFLTDLATYKFAYAAEPFTEEEKQDILSTMNQSLVTIRRFSEASKPDQAYAFFQLGLIHEAFGNVKKSCNFLKQSVQMAVDCGTYASAFPKLMSIVEKDCEENPTVETYKLQAELYEMIRQHQSATKSYKKVRELGDESPDILEKLARNLCRISQYMDARQCLKLLASSCDGEFLIGERKTWFIDVCLKAARQFIEDGERVTAAGIYQELISDILPRDIPAAFTKIVLLSSEHPDDHAKTESLVKLLRNDLGFNEDSCKWPFECHEAYGQHYNDFISSFIKNTWCCVVHLTDKLLQDQIFMLTIMRNSADVLLKQPFGAQLVIIDDLVDSASEETKSKLEAYQCLPTLKYDDLFSENIDTTTTCERMVKGLLDFQ
jgi:tetratricopeptide (TPR) repeat protein